MIFTLYHQNEFVCVSIHSCHYVICERRFNFYTLCRARPVGFVGMSGKRWPFWWDPEFRFRKLSCIKLLKLYMKRKVLSVWIGFVCNGIRSVWEVAEGT